MRPIQKNLLRQRWVSPDPFDKTLRRPRGMCGNVLNQLIVYDHGCRNSFMAFIQVTILTTVPHDRERFHRVTFNSLCSFPSCLSLVTLWTTVDQTHPREDESYVHTHVSLLMPGRIVGGSHTRFTVLQGSSILSSL